MGKGLIPADVETWKVRRRAIVPGFHKSWLNAMVCIAPNISFTRRWQILCRTKLVLLQ